MGWRWKTPPPGAYRVNCRGRRHVALCERNLTSFGESKNARSPGGKEKDLETQSSQPEPAKEEQNTKPAAFCGISTEAENHGTSILLQTAMVRAVNPDDPKKVQTCVSF